MVDLAERLLRDTFALLGTFESNLGTELQLPVLYANGDFVTVVVNANDQGEAIVHDAGFAAMTLANEGRSLSRKATRRAADYAARLGCRFVDGRVSLRCKLDDVASAAMMVGSVCRFVADQGVPDARTSGDFAQKVRDILRAQVGEARMVPNFVVRGHTGSEYEVTAAITSRDPAKPSALVEAVPSPRTVAGRFRHLYEVKANDAYAGIDRLAVYDEEEEFTQGDLLLLQDVSNVVAFSDFQERARRYA